MPSAWVTRSALRAVATTRWPASRAARAMSTPMPRPAPVTRTTFLSDMSSSSVGAGGGPAVCGLSRPRPRRYPGNTGSPHAGQDLRRGVLTVTPWTGPALYARRHGREGGGARGRSRVPHHAPRAGYPGRRRPSPAGHPPPGEGPAPGGGGAAGRSQPGVLRAPGARPGHRPVGGRRGCRCRCAPTGRRRTRPPGPVARRPHARGPQAKYGRGQGPGHPGRAGPAGLAGSPARGGVQRPTRHPRGQRAGPCALRAGVRPAGRAQQRPFPVPRRAPGPGPVPRVGPDRRRHGGHPADRGRPPPR